MLEFKIHHTWLLYLCSITNTLSYTYAHIDTSTYLHVFHELRSHYKITWKYAEHKHLDGVKQKCYIHICYDYVKNAKKGKNAFISKNMLGMPLHYMHTVLNSLVEVPKVLVFEGKKHTHTHMRAIPNAMNKLRIIIKSLNYNHPNTPSISSSRANLLRSIMHWIVATYNETKNHWPKKLNVGNSGSNNEYRWLAIFHSCTSDLHEI